MTIIAQPLAVAIGAVAGLVAGSFIATVAIRWPSGESALSGRSRCDECRAPIGAAALVPLLSFIVQRGHARCCGTRIDPLHPAAEAVAAVIGAVSAVLPLPQAVAGAALGWLLLTLALIDLRHFRLPNVMVALLGASGVAASLYLHTPTPLDALTGAAAGFVSLKAIQLAYRAAQGREGIGSGDPKLFAAIGAWVGWFPLPNVLLAGAVAGLFWAVGRRLIGGHVTMSDRMPLGTLLAIVAWPVWLWWIAGLNR